RPAAGVKRGPDVGEEVPDVADDDAAELVLGNGAVHEQGEAHQDPGEVGRGKDQQAEEVEADVCVAARPDVHEAGGQGAAEEGDRDERAEQQERGGGVEQQPRKNGGRGARGLFEQAGVPLQEEDVEDEVEI
ncbi:hypothetical protein KEM52_001772, partial [Ascosphaera acerosa]